MQERPDQVGNEFAHHAGGDDAVGLAPSHRAVLARHAQQQGTVVRGIDGAVVGVDEVALRVGLQGVTHVRRGRPRHAQMDGLDLSDGRR